MSEATARETAERCCEAALAALERGDADKAQRLAEKAMRLAPSDEVRRKRGGGKQRSIFGDVPPSTTTFVLLPPPPHSRASFSSPSPSIKTGPQGSPRHQVETGNNGGNGKRERLPFLKRGPPPQRLRHRRRRCRPCTRAAAAHARAGRPRLPRPRRRIRLLLHPGAGPLLEQRLRGRDQKGVPQGGAEAPPGQVLRARSRGGLRGGVAGVRVPL